MLSSEGFDLWANDYDKTVRLSEEEDAYPFAGYKDVLGTIYRRVRAGKGRRVLDLGFGTGILAKRLYDEGCTVFGVDFSPEMVRRAGEKMPGATLICSDFAQGLPPELAGERFDFILCTYAIHHLDRAQRTALLRELLAHLKEGGEVLVGDVAFETREQMEACRARSGEEWDDEEFYPVWEELHSDFPGGSFTQISFCAGVLALPGIEG